LAISILLVFNTTLVTWYGARQVLASSLSLGELLVFLAYLGQMFEPLNQLSQVGAVVSSANASVGRVLEILDTTEEVSDSPEARPIVSRSPDKKPAKSARKKRNGRSTTETSNGAA